MNAPPKAFERFVSSLPTYRGSGTDHRRYEELKRDFIRSVPGATPAQYSAAMRAISKATGV